LCQIVNNMIKVGINGFGRIGRIAFRIGLSKHSEELEFGAVNTSGSMPVSGWAHLVNYDTMYRRFEMEIRGNETKKPEEATGEDHKETDDETEEEAEE